MTEYTIKTRVFRLDDVALMWPRLVPRVRACVGEQMTAWLEFAADPMQKNPAATLTHNGTPVAAVGVVCGKVWGLFTQDCEGLGLGLVRALRALTTGYLAGHGELNLSALDAESTRFARLVGFKER